MKGYADIIYGAVTAFAIAVVASVLIVGTQLFGKGVEMLGFTQLTLVYYVTCLCFSIAMLVASPAARKQAKLMLLFAIAVIMVVQVGFLSLIDSPSVNGEPLDAAKEMLGELMNLVTKTYMYVVPALVTTMYALIAVGAQEARNEAEKSSVPRKD